MPPLRKCEGQTGPAVLLARLCRSGLLSHFYGVILGSTFANAQAHPVWQLGEHLAQPLDWR